MTRANSHDDVGAFDPFDDEGPAVFRFGDDDDAAADTVDPVEASPVATGLGAAEPTDGRADLQAVVADLADAFGDDTADAFGDDAPDAPGDEPAPPPSLASVASPTVPTPSAVDEDDEDDDVVEVWSFTTDDEESDDEESDDVDEVAARADDPVEPALGDPTVADGTAHQAPAGDLVDDGADDLSEVAAMLYDLRDDEPEPDEDAGVPADPAVPTTVMAAIGSSDADDADTTAVLEAVGAFGDGDDDARPGPTGAADEVEEAEEADAAEQPAARVAPIDLANFTARGHRVDPTSGGRRRRLAFLPRR